MTGLQTKSMVERMQDLWNKKSTYKIWCSVEAQVLRARDIDGWYEVAGVQIDDEFVNEVSQVEQKTQHEMAAFVSVLATYSPPEISGHIHYGLTSSDVIDTSLAMQIRKGLGHLREQANKLGVPTRWLNLATKEISYGTLSGPMGTYSSTTPEVEGAVLGWLGLEPEPAPTQIVARDRHAYVLQALALTAGVADRLSGKAHRDRWSPGAVYIRTWSAVGLENIGLWHERDISHSSTERVIIPGSFMALCKMFSEMGAR